MPNRVFREGLLTSEKFDALGYGSQCFYTRLLLIVDDYGRYDARPQVLLARLFPLRLNQITTDGIKDALTACVEAKLVDVYTVDGKPYLQILNFRQQKRAKNSKFPAPPDGETCKDDLHNTLTQNVQHVHSMCIADAQQMHSTCTADDTQMSSTCAARAQHLHTKAKAKAKAKAEAVEQLNTSATVKTQALPSSVAAVFAYMEKLPLISLPRDELDRCANAFFDINEERGWVTRDNIPMRNWQNGAKRFVEGWQRKYAERSCEKKWNVKGNVDNNRSQYTGL